MPIAMNVMKDGKWGHVEADGKWSGMMSKAAWEDYDFIISDIFITYLRFPRKQCNAILFFSFLVHIWHKEWNVLVFEFDKSITYYKLLSFSILIH